MPLPDGRPRGEQTEPRPPRITVWNGRFPAVFLFGGTERNRGTHAD